MEEKIIIKGATREQQLKLIEDALEKIYPILDGLSPKTIAEILERINAKISITPVRF